MLQSFRRVFSESLKFFYNLSSGGSWTAQIASEMRRSLRWLMLNGLLGTIADSITGTYQSVYFLSLGATGTEIGLLSSLGGLTTPLAMLPGGWFASRMQTYRRFVVVVEYLARLLVLGLVFLPLLPRGIHPIYVGIGFVILRSFLGSMVNPAWTALMGRAVPSEWRGRYFSARNIATSGVSFVALLAAGRLVDRLGDTSGYPAILLVAVLFGLGGTFALSRIVEPVRDSAPPARFHLRTLAARIGAQPAFLTFGLTAALWSLSVNIAAPFFMVFLVDEVGASASIVGTVSALATLAGLPAQRVFGVLNDRKGARWVQRLTGFMIPLLPGVWGFITQPWQALPLQMLNAFAWAGYNLASFNLMFEVTPEEDRPAFVAAYQILTGLGVTGGAALGGWLVETQGYVAAFLLSSLGRFFAATLFALVVVRAGSPVWPWGRGARAENQDS